MHRQRQQVIAAAAVARSTQLWGFGAPGSTQLLTTVRAALAEAARGVQEYVAAMMRRWGRDPDPAGRVPARVFALTASDGRPLDSLLALPAATVRDLVAQGMPQGRATVVGRGQLTRIVATQVADAARVATGVAIVNDRKTHGWTRMLTLPSCSRCIILAGQWYAVLDGFERHPLCDCVHMPAAEVIDPPDPRTLFDAMSDEELRKAGWVAADVRAIKEDGADIFQVTNARRALRSVEFAGRQVQTTLIGASRRGLAGQRLGARRGGKAIRLTPESIYAEAQRLGWSRDETIRQLVRFGYIVDGGR